MISNSLLNSIKENEGFSSTLYTCPAGFKTIGYGTNVEAGITKEEAECLLKSSIEKIVKELDNRGITRGLKERKREVLIEMAYQLGVGGLFKFKNMINAIARGADFEVFYEMLDSLWAKQTTNRAKKLAIKWVSDAREINGIKVGGENDTALVNLANSIINKKITKTEFLRRVQ